MLHPMNDGTLDVLILGPMGAGVAPSEQNCVRLKAAVEELLARAEFTERLRACGYQRFNVTAPEHLQGNRIANEVFRELDKADLVVLDLSSRPGTTAPSPNVMYELALVHALGLPFMLISSTMDPAPFYVAHDRVRHAAYDKLDATAAELYGPFAAYLDPKNRQNFADSRATCTSGEPVSLATRPKSEMILLVVSTCMPVRGKLLLQPSSTAMSMPAPAKCG